MGCIGSKDSGLAYAVCWVLDQTEGRLRKQLAESGFIKAARKAGLQPAGPRVDSMAGTDLDQFGDAQVTELPCVPVHLLQRTPSRRLGAEDDQPARPRAKRHHRPRLADVGEHRPNIHPPPRLELLFEPARVRLSIGECNVAEACEPGRDLGLAPAKPER